jgi:hypothetical protein
MTSSNPPNSLNLAFPVDEELFQALTLDEHVIEPLYHTPLSNMNSLHSSLSSPSSLKEDILA